MGHEIKIIQTRFTTLLEDIAHTYKLPPPLWHQRYHKRRAVYKVKLSVIPGEGKRCCIFRSQSHPTLNSAMQCAAHAAIIKLKAIFGFEIGDYNLAAGMRDRDRRRNAEGLVAAHKQQYTALKEEVRGLDMTNHTPLEEQYMEQRKKRTVADVNAMYWKLECKRLKNVLVRYEMRNRKLQQLLKMKCSRCRV